MRPGSSGVCWMATTFAFLRQLRRSERDPMNVNKTEAKA